MDGAVTKGVEGAGLRERGSTRGFPDRIVTLQSLIVIEGAEEGTGFSISVFGKYWTGSL